MKRKVSSMACDACRLRKIKCDTRSPLCGNCQIYGTACKYDSPRRRRGPRPLEQSHVDETVSFEPAADQQTSPARSDRNPTVGLAVPSPEISFVQNHFPGTEVQTSLHPMTAGSVTAASPLSNRASAPSPSHLYAAGSASTYGPRLAADIQQEFALALSSYESPSILAERCIRKYVLFRFSVCPTIHVESVRGSIPLLSRSPRASTSHHQIDDEGPEDRSTLHSLPWSLEDMRSYTLLTAICAIMCTTPQADLITPYDETKLAKVFLSASQRMLTCYSDVDMERPNASSLMIRYLQSNTLHYFGNTTGAMHLLRCTWSLALTLRLHDEASLAGVDEVEGQLRRNMFWCMYQSDKSASLLSGAPSMVIGISLEEPITLAIENPSGQNLLNDSVISSGGDEFEQQVMVGFYLSTNIWKIGGDILADLKLINHMRARAAPNEPCTAQVRDTTIMHSYSTFCSLMDDVPLWLHNPDSYTCREEALGTTPGGSDETLGQTHFRRRCLWAQKANLVITYHCLQLAIIRQAGKLQLCHLFGRTEDEPWLALRKLNITSDLLSSAKHLPLEALQANGEPCVSTLLSRSSKSVANFHGCLG
jgi:Zn(2)-Cys(6) binuclear cluster domain-containing protein